MVLCPEFLDGSGWVSPGLIGCEPTRRTPYSSAGGCSKRVSRRVLILKTVGSEMVLKLEVEWSPQVFPPKEKFRSFMGLTSVYAGCRVEVLELRLDRMCALLYISLHINETRG